MGAGCLFAAWVGSGLLALFAEFVWGLPIRWRDGGRVYVLGEPLVGCSLRSCSLAMSPLVAIGTSGHLG